VTTTARPSVTSSAVATAIDQAIVSGVSFAVSAALIFFSTPEEYGRYNFLFSTFLLLAAVQAAAVNTPTMVLSPRLTSAARADFDLALRTILISAMPAAMIAGALAMGLSHSEASSFGAMAAVGVAFVLLLLRDYYRTQEFAQFRPFNAVRRDSLYAAVALAGIGILLAAGELTAETAVAATGSASLIAILAGKMPDFQMASRALVRRTLLQTWPLSKWGLLGATGSWLQANAFILVPFFLVGPAEVAELAAARLILMPASLAVQSWTNTLRPLASRMFHENRVDAVRRTVVKSVLVLLAALAAYVSAVLVLLAVVPRHLIPRDYEHVGPYVIMWAVIVGIQVFRINAAAILQALLAFRPLAVSQVVVASYAIIATLVLTRLLGGIGPLLVLASSELIFTAVLLGALRAASVTARNA
jgi:O-antigen/teichoic acid export membrane protein